MKKFLLTFPVLLFIAAGCNSNQANTNQTVSTGSANQQVENSQDSKIKTYTSTKYGFSIDYLADWTVAEEANKITFTSPATKELKSTNTPFVDFAFDIVHDDLTGWTSKTEVIGEKTFTIYDPKNLLTEDYHFRTNYKGQVYEFSGSSVTIHKMLSTLKFLK